MLHCRSLKEEEDFIDVTLSCEETQYGAHKVVLSACSPYFRKLLKVTQQILVFPETISEKTFPPCWWPGQHCEYLNQFTKYVPVPSGNSTVYTVLVSPSRQTPVPRRSHLQKHPTFF